MTLEIDPTEAQEKEEGTLEITDEILETDEEIHGTGEITEGGNRLPKTRVRIQLQAFISLPQGSPLTHRQRGICRQS